MAKIKDFIQPWLDKHAIHSKGSLEKCNQALDRIITTKESTDLTPAEYNILGITLLYRNYIALLKEELEDAVAKSSTNVSL